VRRFTQHDAGRAVFFVAQSNGACDGIGGQLLPCKGEVHVDAGEDFGVCGRALAGQAHAASAYLVSAAFKDAHDIVGGAAAGAGKYGFQRAGSQVLAPLVGVGGIWRAVHVQSVAAAGFGNKAHARACAGSAGPSDCAFHGVFYLV